MNPPEVGPTQVDGIAIRRTGASWSIAGLRRVVAQGLRGVTLQGLGVVTLYCAAYGALLSLDPKTGGIAQNVDAYLIGFTAALKLFLPVFFVVTIAGNFAPERLLPRTLVLGLAVVLGVAVGYIAMAGPSRVVDTWHRTSPIPFVIVGWLGLAIYLLLERDRAAGQALHEEAERQLNLRRQMSEAQLQVLQSQIEPHFLFNALAHIRRLYQTDPQGGRAMMRHLTRYLSAALPLMREIGIGLGEDLELAVAYLNVQKIRMGGRLMFEIDVPARAESARIPPMSITTLVENSIKHGLAPLPEGGMVRIVAQLADDAVTIRVSDNGQGFQANLGAGVGLANVRARLSLLLGEDATLSLSRNSPRGVIATIVIPFRTSAA